MATHRRSSVTGSTTVTVTTDDADLANQVDDFIEYDLICKILDKAEEIPDRLQHLQLIIDWCRTKLRDFVIKELKKLPFVHQWANRIGITVVEFIFTLAMTMLKFMKVALWSPEMWTTANSSAMKAWNDNEDNGVLSQAYAYGKKMAAFLLEVLRQCFERALVVKGLVLCAEDKDEISKILDQLLPANECQ